MCACVTCILTLSACRSTRPDEGDSGIETADGNVAVDLGVTNGMSTNMMPTNAAPADQVAADAPSPNQPTLKLTTENAAATNAALADPVNADAASTSAATPSAAEGAMGGLADGGARLKPGLTVHVKVLVLGKTEIDEQDRRVSDEGFLVLPLIGSVKVEGMRLGDLASDLTERYKGFFRFPEVVVDYVMEQGSNAISPWGYVTVLGRVKNSGQVSIPPTRDLTVSAAIQRAGGLDSSARDSAIRVTRRKDDGTAEIIQVDLPAVGSRGGARGSDPVLRHGDVVFVPEMIF